MKVRAAGQYLDMTVHPRSNGAGYTFKTGSKCGGLIRMNVNCPKYCRFVINMNSLEFWIHFDLSQAPSKVTVDLDDDTYAALVREITDHKTTVATVTRVLLQEAAEGLRKIPRR